MLKRIEQHVRRHALALYAVAGGVLGAGAWWSTDGGTTWALLLPFVVGLSRRRGHAFSVSAAYYLCALIYWPSMAGGTPAAWAVWLIVGLLAGGAWSLVPDPKGRTLHTGVRLVLVWALTWATPVGWFGAVHPMLAWAFPGDGFMGPLSQIAAPFITAFFVVAIRLETGDHRWSWRSGRVLAMALLLILQVKGIGEHAIASRHAAGVAALHGRWLESEQASGLEGEARAEKVVQTLLGLGRPHHEPPLVALLAVTSVGLDDEALADRLQVAVSSSGVALMVARRVEPGLSWEGTLFPVDASAKRLLIACGHAWLPEWALSWVTGCNTRHGAPALPGLSPMRVAVVFPGSALSPGWLSVTTAADRPDVWLLVAAADGARAERALRVILKHQRANALLSKRPLVGALLLPARP